MLKFREGSKKTQYFHDETILLPKTHTFIKTHVQYVNLGHILVVIIFACLYSNSTSLYFVSYKAYHTGSMSQ